LKEGYRPKKPKRGRCKNIKQAKGSRPAEQGPFTHRLVDYETCERSNYRGLVGRGAGKKVEHSIKKKLNAYVGNTSGAGLGKNETPRKAVHLPIFKKGRKCFGGIFKSFA